MASANNGKEFLDLSVKEFTFAIMGRDTTHFHNEVDDLFDITNFGYKEIASYLKYISEGWDQCILAAIKEDMALAFDEFMFNSTSVATPIGYKGHIQVKDTVPEHIVWESGDGRVCDMSYDGIDIYCEYEPFDSISLIDEYRMSKGLPKLSSLEFKEFEVAKTIETHDLFVKFQREHFEKHTLYTYAIGLINQHLEETEGDDKSVQTQPNTLHKDVRLPQTKGRPKSLPKGLWDRLIGSDSDREATMSILRRLISGKKGKAVVLVVLGCMEAGKMMSKPTHGELKDAFGEIGHRSGYDKYFKEAEYNYTKEEIDRASLNFK